MLSFPPTFRKKKKKPTKHRTLCHCYFEWPLASSSKKTMCQFKSSEKPLHRWRKYQ